MPGRDGRTDSRSLASGDRWTELGSFPAAQHVRGGALAKQVPSRSPEAPEDHSCVMCWEKPRQATLAPCGHRAL